MNVLAAPFLYTMPSEMEAFFCFAKFIEESCPLYVQPTLEGVHRGLKVMRVLICQIKSLKSPSCWIVVFNLLILSFLDTYDLRIFPPKSMPFLVSCSPFGVAPLAHVVQPS